MSKDEDRIIGNALKAIRKLARKRAASDLFKDDPDVESEEDEDEALAVPSKPKTLTSLSRLASLTAES